MRPDVDESKVISSFYREHASQFLASHFIDQTVNRFQPSASISSALVVGSYLFSIVPRLRHFRDIVAIDLSEGMLAYSCEGYDVQRVQGDVRALPFNSAFDFICMLGSVTAYMLTPEDIDACTRSLSRALKPGATVLVDAYDAASVVEAGYFTTPAHFPVDGEPWTVRPALNRLCASESIYAVTAEYFRHSPGKQCDASHRFETNFLQRFFLLDELSSSLSGAGLREISRYRDSRSGRLYLAMKKPLAE